MDECDRGSETAEKYLGGAIAARRAAANRGGAILKYCVACGEEIAAARRDNAQQNGRPCERCIMCQNNFEKGTA